ncbi:MAG TPA: hypothetical protein VMM82_00850, partial [Spirochaetia bacterium]|nr:hypothetical protein [Spirochaetia bacterium]
MKRFISLASVWLLAIPMYAGAQSAQNPDDMFGGNMVQEQPAQAPASGPESLLQSKGVDIGGYLFSDYTTFAFWQSAYPTVSDPTS